MTIEFRKRHGVFMLVLAAIQLTGLSISLSKSPDGPAVLDFLRLGGWPGYVILGSLVFSSAFTTAAIIAELMKVFTSRNR